jgi:hypothetical protein
LIFEGKNTISFVSGSQIQEKASSGTIRVGLFTTHHDCEIGKNSLGILGYVSVLQLSSGRGALAPKIICQMFHNLSLWIVHSNV